MFRIMVALAALAIPLAPLAHADASVPKGHRKDNLQKAIDLVKELSKKLYDEFEKNGRPEDREASLLWDDYYQNLDWMLENDRILLDPALDAKGQNGETTPRARIHVRPSAVMDTALDPSDPSQFEQLLTIASILVHEKTHVIRQWENDPWEEWYEKSPLVKWLLEDTGLEHAPYRVEIHFLLQWRRMLGAGTVPGDDRKDRVEGLIRDAVKEARDHAPGAAGEIEKAVRDAGVALPPGRADSGGRGAPGGGPRGGSGAPPRVHRAGPQAAGVAHSVAGGLRTVRFRSEAGEVLVHLPADLVEGETVTGTVALAEKPETLRGRTAAWSVTAGAAGRARPGEPLRLSVPRTPAFELALLEGNRIVRKTQVPVFQDAPYVRLAGAAATAGFRFPSAAQAGESFQVTGPFDGDAANARVTVAGRETRVLAESPRRLVAALPAEALGTTEIAIREGRRSASAQVRAVTVRLTPAGGASRPGERTEVLVEVAGLDRSSGVGLWVVHATPELARLEGGDVQSVWIRPADVGADGRARITLALTVLRPGTFSLRGSLQPAPAP